MSEINKPVLTDDGSHTVISDLYGVSYHSLHGAIQETNTVFLEMGLQYKIDQFRATSNPNKIKVFEMGFGTGLNALCTYDKIVNSANSIEYTTIEAHPIALEEIQKLNYIELLDDQYQDVFDKMHESVSGEVVSFPSFNFIKFIGTIEQWESDKKFDLIYFDAFSPTTQPELWEVPIIKKMYDILSEGGILCTYCAKGAFKRVLREVGFKLESLPGPGRKREITRAIKRKVH